MDMRDLGDIRRRVFEEESEHGQLVEAVMSITEAIVDIRDLLAAKNTSPKEESERNRALRNARANWGLPIQTP